MKPILCLDFDGVCNSYKSGWNGANVIPDEPVSGLFQFLKAVSQEFKICIFSSRSHQTGGIEAMQEWFVRWCPVTYLDVVEALEFPTVKPPAFIGIDDRVLTFTGTFPSVETLKNFKPWNHQEV